MKLLLSENEIKDRVKALGKKITKDYEGKKPIFIGILNGCYVFMADLLREVELDVEVDFVKIRSYEGDSSTGTIKFRKDISADIDGRDVIIDSKVSLTAWDRYVNATDESEKTEALNDHRKSIKAHIDSLASKNYQNIKDINSLDTVIMFCPNETAS